MNNVTVNKSNTSIVPARQSWRRFGMSVIFAVTASFLSTLAFGYTSVTNAEFSSNAEQRSLTIDLSSNAKYTVFSLDKPGRLVIDLEKIDIRSAQKIFAAKKLIPGIIGIRIGTPYADTTRLVFDLSKSLAQLHASHHPASHGEERILVRWEMPTFLAIRGKPDGSRSSRAETSTLVSDEVQKPSVRTPENIEQNKVQSSNNGGNATDNEKPDNAYNISFVDGKFVHDVAPQHKAENSSRGNATDNEKPDNAYNIRFVDGKFVHDAAPQPEPSPKPAPQPSPKPAPQPAPFQNQATDSHPAVVNGKPDKENSSRAEASILPLPESKKQAALRYYEAAAQGNTLLETRLIDRLLNPFKGENRSFTDIQRALEALEGAYRSAGYSAVHVDTPEQDITEGKVIFQVMETVVGKVTLKGNQHYDKTNIRNALPVLAEGYTPNSRQLSENLRLANENPTRHMDVIFSQGEEENTVNAEVNVQDSSPHKVFATFDNTGSASTGMYRLGVGYQNNNLFNRDHAATFNFVTSPGYFSDVKQYSGSYRFPLYAIGDSIDVIAAHSDSNAGTSPIVGGNLLSFSGKGNVYGVHYNHFIPRDGDYISRLIGGLDYRAYLNNCQINGQAICGSSGNDLTVHPLSLTYNGTLTKPTYVADFSTSMVHNLPGGVHGTGSDFIAVRASPTNPLIGAPANYTIFRFNGSVTGVLPQEWQYRVAGNLQYTRDPLVTYEGIGLVGANSVRGFLEREIANDKGIVLNFEVYTPELAPKLNIKEGSFRLLGFMDRGWGWNVQLPGDPIVQDSVASVGLGFRYAPSKDITTKFDFARVTGAEVTGPTGSPRKSGDTRGQLGVMVNW